ncbi:MAG: F-type H+-transporting ATPase subunit b [Nitrospirae bacterium]|nr:MAG: F-type H+-transporting ATPase subunit b [Nitrospirota bacterium]
MLEFNQWFFVLLANFIILLIALNSLLFQPLSKIFKERDRATKGALDEAKAMTAKKDDAVAKMNAELVAARQKAKETSSVLREAGVAQQKEAMSKAEAAAVQQIEAARKELQAETEKARVALKGDIDKFADDIVRKLVTV